MTEEDRYIKKLHAFTNAINFAEKDVASNLIEAQKFVKVVRTNLEVDSLNTYVMNIKTENLVLTRARNNKSKGVLFNTLEDLIYPKPEYIDKHGRANTWRQARYYCADVRGTALFETRPLNEWVTTVDIKINKPVLKLLVVGPNTKYEIPGDHNFTSKEKAFNRFMAEKFIESVPPDKDYLYLPTAIITNLLINQVDGIVFPSVASNLKGENFALRTEIFDEHAEIIETRVQETYDHKSPYDFKVRCLYRANSYRADNFIQWKKVKCSGHDINEKIYH